MIDALVLSGVAHTLVWSAALMILGSVSLVTRSRYGVLVTVILGCVFLV